MNIQTEIIDTDYVASYSDHYIKRFRTLPKGAMIELALHWLHEPSCHPIADWSQVEESKSKEDQQEQEEEEEELDPEMSMYTINTEMDIELASVKKAKVIQAMIDEYKRLQTTDEPRPWIVAMMMENHWCYGLNMLQISFVDLYLLVHEETSPGWWSSSQLIRNNDRTNLFYDDHLCTNPQLIMQRFRRALRPMLPAHSSFHVHPLLKLMIIRVQPFVVKDISQLEALMLAEEAADREDVRKSSEIVKYFRPMPPSVFLVIPFSGSAIVHTYFKISRMSVKIRVILQALRMALSLPTKQLEFKSTGIVTHSFKPFFQVVTDMEKKKKDSFDAKRIQIPKPFEQQNLFKSAPKSSFVNGGGSQQNGTAAMRSNVRKQKRNLTSVNLQPLLNHHNRFRYHVPEEDDFLKESVEDGTLRKNRKRRVPRRALPKKIQSIHEDGEEEEEEEEAYDDEDEDGSENDDSEHSYDDDDNDNSD